MKLKFRIHLVLDEKKIKKEEPTRDIPAVYESFREFLSYPKYHLKEIKVKKGIMFESTDKHPTNPRAGITKMNWEIASNAWCRKYLKVWACYNNLDCREGEWNYEDCERAFSDNEKKHNFSFLDEEYQKR